jgi:hypothetical protein
MEKQTGMIDVTKAPTHMNCKTPGQSEEMEPPGDQAMDVDLT